MRTLASIVLTVVSSQAMAATCPNAVACKGLLQASLLTARPLFISAVDATCSETAYDGTPHCAQLAWNPNVPLPVIVYGETDVSPDGPWVNAARSPVHWPGMTPNAVLGELQNYITPAMACTIDEYGDTRGNGMAPGWGQTCKACMRSSAGGDMVQWVWSEWHGDRAQAWAWSEGDASECPAE